MTQADPTTECLLNTIVGFMLPFFLAGANGNPNAARTAITQLIQAYNPSTPAELDLVGRIIGFSMAAIDNLRLSMVPDISDTKALRYRANAATLSRASDKARAILEARQANQSPTQPVPRPSIAAAPAPKPAQPIKPSAPTAPLDIEAMKRDARVMMNVFSKTSATSSTAMPIIPDPAAAIAAATRAAIAIARRT